MDKLALESALKKIDKNLAKEFKSRDDRINELEKAIKHLNERLMQLESK